MANRYRVGIGPQSFEFVDADSFEDNANGRVTFSRGHERGKAFVAHFWKPLYVIQIDGHELVTEPERIGPALSTHEEQGFRELGRDVKA